MQQLLSMGALPSTLSSRAKPRDLRFSGPFVEMFFDRAKRKGGTCGSFNQRPMPPQAPPYPLSSRPEFSWAVGPPKEMKNGSHAATALHGRATLHPVIPSEGERPAVQRTFRGNVFRQSEPGFPPTRSSPTPTCAAFHLRKPHEARQPHQVRQEIRGSAVEGPAVRFLSIRADGCNKGHQPTLCHPEQPTCLWQM